MPADAIVRKATQDDAHAIWEIVDSFKFSPHMTGKLIPLDEPKILELVSKGLFYVAQCPEGVVGCVSIVEYEINHGIGKIAELRSLAVNEKYQLNGLGRQLVQDCITNLAGEYSVVYVLTQKDNFGFFEKQGFVRTDAPLEKLASDCYRCPYYNNGCVETAFAKQLR